MKTLPWQKACRAHGNNYLGSGVPVAKVNFLLLRYVRVRYEDLVSKKHTEDIIKELHDFMGIPYNLESQKSTLGGLVHGESDASQEGYYGLFRDKSFDPNHWTKELSQEVK